MNEVQEAVENLVSQMNSQPRFAPKMDAIIQRLIGLERGESISLQPPDGYTSEQWRDKIRTGLGDRKEVEGRNYHFTTTSDNLVVSWTRVQVVETRGRKVLRDWSGVIAQASELKENETCEFDIPEGDDAQKYKTNLLTTLGYNSAVTKMFRWGVSHTKGAKKIIVTKYGLRADVPAPLRPQNMPKLDPAPPINIPPVVAPPISAKTYSEYGSIIAALEHKAVTMQQEVDKIWTAIEVLRSLP